MPGAGSARGSRTEVLRAGRRGDKRLTGLSKGIAWGTARTPNSAQTKVGQLPLHLTQRATEGLTLDVTRDGPLSLANHRLDRLGNLRASLGDVVELRLGIS